MPQPETPKNGLTTAPDNTPRCWWHGGHADYLAYHDNEWGHPVTDDNCLFEKICLEGFQAGLSWHTILKKRDHFRAAFAGFDIHKVARFTPANVEQLLTDAGIVRHRGKIESTIKNAKQAIALTKEHGSLAAYFWQFEPADADRPKKLDFPTLQTLGKTPTSIALSKDLKKRGWSFVGPTTCYAFMQAMGLVNDHLEGCTSRPLIEKKRATFKRPTSG